MKFRAGIAWSLVAAFACAEPALGQVESACRMDVRQAAKMVSECATAVDGEEAAWLQQSIRAILGAPSAIPADKSLQGILLSNLPRLATFKPKSSQLSKVPLCTRNPIDLQYSAKD